MRILARKTVKKNVVPFAYRYRPAEISNGKICVGSQSFDELAEARQCMAEHEFTFVLDLGPGLDLSSDDEQ